MDFLPDLSTLSAWLAQYGCLFLFVLLALGIVIFPVPEETMMMVAGILMHRGKLPIAGTILAACAGSMCGITISYLIGKSAGIYIITKYGKWVGLHHGRIKKAHNWFERYGKWALFFGYFIPGVRHFTGLSAGATNLGFKKFVLFAYSGAAVWVSIFLALGYYFGHMALSFYERLELTFDEAILVLVGGGILVAIVFAIYLATKKRAG